MVLPRRPSTPHKLAAAAVLLFWFEVQFPWTSDDPSPLQAASLVLETDTNDANQDNLTPVDIAAPDPISVVPEASPPCPDDMVYVAGDFCQGLAHICKRYIDEKGDRCAEFLPTSRCVGQSIAIRVCVDRYEQPNQAGAKPVLGINWEQAKSACQEQGKRLCTANEWTLACEGPGRLPYPYGYTRDRDACNIDKPYIVPDDVAFANKATREIEMARLDQREASGSRPGCVSSYGIFDTTGNVDEWVDYEKGTWENPPYRSGLKGGYWGPVRNRCRPITATHNRWHYGYQIGFRCCRDPFPSSG